MGSNRTRHPFKGDTFQKGPLGPAQKNHKPKNSEKWFEMAVIQRESGPKAHKTTPNTQNLKFMRRLQNEFKN